MLVMPETVGPKALFVHEVGAFLKMRYLGYPPGTESGEGGHRIVDDLTRIHGFLRT